MGEEAIEELPKAIVRRVVKEKLTECSEAGDISLHKGALLAFGESARVFIHYLSATANEFCKESKRQTMNAEDVLKAIEEIEFLEFLGPLRASLEDYRRKNSKKRTGAANSKEVNKKRKENGGQTEEIEEGNKDGDDVSDQEQLNDPDGKDNQDHDDDASDQEQLNGPDGEDNQDHNDDANDHTLQDLADIDQEQQDPVNEKEKHSEDATEYQTDNENRVECLSVEPAVDEGNQEEEHIKTGSPKED